MGGPWKSRWHAQQVGCARFQNKGRWAWRPFRCNASFRDQENFVLVGCFKIEGSNNETEAKDEVDVYRWNFLRKVWRLRLQDHSAAYGHRPINQCRVLKWWWDRASLILIDANFCPNLNPIKQIQYICIEHVDASYRPWWAQLIMIWDTVNVNVSLHRIDISKPILSEFLAAQP